MKIIEAKQAHLNHSNKEENKKRWKYAYTPIFLLTFVLTIFLFDTGVIDFDSHSKNIFAVFLLFITYLIIFNFLMNRLRSLKGKDGTFGIIELWDIKKEKTYARVIEDGEVYKFQKLQNIRSFRLYGKKTKKTLVYFPGSFSNLKLDTFEENYSIREVFLISVDFSLIPGEIIYPQIPFFCRELIEKAFNDFLTIELKSQDMSVPQIKDFVIRNLNDESTVNRFNTYLQNNFPIIQVSKICFEKK